VKDPDEVKKAELKSKKYLTELDLWFGSRTNRRIIRDDEVLEALEPPPDVDLLRIYGYQGVLPVLPSWINKLKVVTLMDWKKIENLPPLGKLPSLEKLIVGWMGCVKKMGNEFLGLEVDDDDDISVEDMTSSNTIIAFPKLKRLSFYNMTNWEEWEGGEGGNEDKIMPSLRYLHFWYCPKLKALPDYVFRSTTLEELRIRGSPILEEQFKAGGKGWHNASHTPTIKIGYD